MHFNPDDRVFLLSNQHKIQVWQLCQIFFSNVYLFDSNFSVIVWTNRLLDSDEGMCFPNNCCYENW